jgi:hypothetical protein
VGKKGRVRGGEKGDRLRMGLREVKRGQVKGGKKAQVKDGEKGTG